MNHLPVNAHIHLPPNFSAFDTAAEAVQLAREQGVCALGASNYYDYTVYSEFSAQCEKQGILPLFGTEIICMIDVLREAGIKINDPGNPGKMYLCGKAITRFGQMTERAAALLQTIRDDDSRRMAAMIDRMTEQFRLAGIEIALNESHVKAMVVARHGSPESTVCLQERHIAQAFQERMFETISLQLRAEALTRLFGAAPKSDAGDAVGIQNEVRTHLMKAGKRAFVPETFVDFHHAYNLILELGGVPCYPILADGATPVCGYEEDIEALIAATRSSNIHCCELIPVRNSPEQVVRYATSMRQAGFIVTAGTEHNTRELIAMAPTCVNGIPIPDEVQDIFWEGTCVLAAHQYLSALQKPGYVDPAGVPAGRYASHEARISALKSLGETIIRDATALQAQ